jgi:hypothetical protein
MNAAAKALGPRTEGRGFTWRSYRLHMFAHRPAGRRRFGLAPSTNTTSSQWPLTEETRHYPQYKTFVFHSQGLARNTRSIGCNRDDNFSTAAGIGRQTFAAGLLTSPRLQPWSALTVGPTMARM